MVFENFQEEVIEALAVVDSNIWHLLSDKSIRKCMAKSNSVGLQSSLDLKISYNRARLNVYHIAYLKESLVLSTNKGVFRVILDTNQVIHHIGDHLKMASYLLYQVTGIYYNLMKSKILSADTNVLLEAELRFIYDFTHQLE